MPAPHKPTSRRLYELTLITAFLAAICLPLAAQLTGWRAVSTTQFASQERRDPAPMPKWKWSAAGVRRYARGFDAWYRDHFGLRGDAIRVPPALQRAVGAPLMGDHGVATRAVDGPTGWYFLGDAQNDVLKLSTGHLKHTDATIAEVVAQMEQRRQQFAARGISVILLIPPDKSSIYGQYLPSWCGITTRRTATDQLVQAFTATSGFNVIDLRPVLRDARAQYGDLLYYKTDSHWTSLGAYVGYARLMQACAQTMPSLQPLKMSAYACGTRETPGDILILAGIEQLLPDHEIQLTLTDATGRVCLPADARRRRGPAAETFVWRNSLRDPESRMLLVGDSFAEALQPLLAQTFGKVAFAHNLNNSPDEVLTWMDSFEPRVVVIEVVERMLPSVAKSWAATQNVAPRRPPRR